MNHPQLELIVAVDSNLGFGKGGKIPWKCKEDMARFTRVSKEIRVCVMGKHTYTDMRDMQLEKDGAEERIKEKGILPERESFVISSTLKQEDVIGATVVPDLRAVINLYENTDQRIAVIGGEKLYIQALSSATKLHMTIIPREFDCDRFIPVDPIQNNFHIDSSASETVEATVDETQERIHFATYVRNNQ
ncbi:trimethoprim-resistant dihydrofolate reductase DfrA19 [Enterobacter hormaechei subsp. steigerwaltii]|uniref:dihydrofolate reductase n=2 Tax=Enterobacteriaceae TaxID=543 RepID=A0A9N8GV34_9ENTR|nr:MULTISPECIES: trimethoprim-resistant dihydrofolate reductase DfrA19 [Enterobacterales]ECD5024945.1 DfrA18/DfrA19 family trimethoprim-resistant dihydrofolate reductase [Salmonella enterica subsp. enterica serovar Stanley]EJZ8388560.1 trimethoprim-resistant dihydrofolate reductase DfrA19 [Klebsiella oxytoca]MCU2324976.1 trimethoprim-resistant dihydrofolate reductase DfrA19 [Enterobacter hormaechei subsp. steigerwaltii]MCU3342166.1 trimethoprim-resistant dihydrofolate reductase DfrA19 [Enteroba